jgi:hypothetical protein
MSQKSISPEKAQALLSFLNSGEKTLNRPRENDFTNPPYREPLSAPTHTSCCIPAGSDHGRVNKFDGFCQNLLKTGGFGQNRTKKPAKLLFTNSKF